nr:hypothetical protein [uncultured Rhodopila sp.]
MIDEHPIRIRFQAVGPSLDERSRRLNAAAEAVSAGHGGVAAASRATKVARGTIGRGLNELRDPALLTGKVRRKAAGRHKLTAKDPTQLRDLEQLLQPVTMGDPMRPLRRVSKRHEKLAPALREMGHQASASTIPKLLETTTKTGLTIRCELDANSYRKRIKVSAEEIATVNLKGTDFYPDRNDTISPSERNMERYFPDVALIRGIGVTALLAVYRQEMSHLFPCSSDPASDHRRVPGRNPLPATPISFRIFAMNRRADGSHDAQCDDRVIGLVINDVERDIPGRPDA